MPVRNRNLSMADVGDLVALIREEPDHRKVFKAVERIAAETCGWVLLTTLKYDEPRGVVVRVHSSDEKAYPVGGTKPLAKLVSNHAAMAQGEVFHAANRAAVKEAFFDYELIFSLGITAILNAPIRHAGRRLGTLNFSGTEGMYGPQEIATAKILAGLLVPCLLSDPAT